MCIRDRNDTLTYYANYLANADDTSQDANIASYLKKFTMNGRPYGHGYLGAAYIGYLAGGAGAVTDTNIATGMNKIFTDLLNGKSLENAIQDNAGISTAQLNNMFKTGDASLTEFVRRLSYASKDGAGSIITGKANGLGVGGSSLLGTNAIFNQPFQIDPFQVSVDLSGPSAIGLQVGACLLYTSDAADD